VLQQGRPVPAAHVEGAAVDGVGQQQRDRPRRVGALGGHLRRGRDDGWEAVTHSCDDQQRQTRDQADGDEVKFCYSSLQNTILKINVCDL